MNYSRNWKLKRAELLKTNPHTTDTIPPEEIVAKFADALTQFEPIDVQPSDTDLTQIQEVLALFLLQISYNKTEVTHNLIGLIRSVASYTTR